jgi:hypothetical protein
MDAHGMGTRPPAHHKSHHPYGHGAATKLSMNKFDFDQKAGCLLPISGIMHPEQGQAEVLGV